MENPRPKKRMAYGPEGGKHSHGYKGVNGRLENLLVQFETSSVKMSIDEAVVDAVMKEEKSYITKRHSEQRQMDSDSESSDDIARDMNGGVLAVDREYKQNLAELERQKPHLRYMIDNHEIFMERYNFHSPLSKTLPEEKRKWMKHKEMEGSSFKPSNHKGSGLNGPGGLLDHLKQLQQTCIYNRGLFLWYYVHGGKQL